MLRGTLLRCVAFVYYKDVLIDFFMLRFHAHLGELSIVD